MTVPFAVGDVLRFLVLALVWTLAGRGLLALLRQRAMGTTGWLLSPAVAHTVIAVTLGMSAVLGLPIRTVSVPLWTGILVLAAAGLTVECRARIRKTESPGAEPALVLAIAVLVPTTVLLPYFVHGFGVYAGTTHPDAWSYIVFGDYLWEYPRGTQGGLAPVYQWAANLSGTRFVAPASLGWLAAATHEGDTQAAFGLLLALSTFVVGSACAAAARVLGLPAYLQLLVALGGGAGNWIANAILVSNLDNLLALPYLPALVVCALDDSPTAPHGRALLVGLLAAAAMYTYPEFAFIVLGCSSLFFAGPLLGRPVRQSLTGIAIAGLVAGVLVLPYVIDLLRFLLSQLAAGVRVGPRPAEGLFSGLLEPVSRLAALWAFGPEDQAVPPWWPGTLAAAGLSLLALAGFHRLARNRELAPLATIALLVAGFSIFAWRFDYSYGAYKFILLGWWLVVVAVAFGVRECSRLHPLVTVAAAVLATATFAVSANRAVREAGAPPQPDIAALREVGAAARIAHGAPMAIAVADNTAVHWATYFLRAANTRLVSYSGYLAAAHVQPTMAQTTPIPWDSLRLLLTDATDAGPFVEQQHWKRLWHNDQYALWDTGDVGWAVVWKIDNGYPSATGPGLVWVGDKPVSVVVSTNTAGIASVHAILALSQGLAPTIGPMRLQAADGAGVTCEWTVAPDGWSLRFGLEPGQNTVTLTKSWPLAVPLAPDSDQRHPFMFGLVKPTLEFSRGVPAASTYCP